jgi:hypothetical protein
MKQMLVLDEQHCIDKCAVLTAKAATHDELKMI